MPRPAVLWAGVLLLAAVGCVRDGFLAHPFRPARYTQVVDAAPGSVAAVLEAGFGSVGVPVLVKRDGGEIRLVGKTKAGQAFCVYLRSEKGAAAKTSVRAHWDAQPDEDLWQGVVEWLGTFAPQGDDAR